MPLPPLLNALKLPLIGSPMFIISSPELVIAQCKAGIVGSFPVLNARQKDGEPNELDRWLTRITEALDRYNQENPDTPAAPYAVNQIVHRSNERLEQDVEICLKHNVPLWITSMGAQSWLNDAVHANGGLVLHDVINNRFARKAIEKGADGLIAVAAGAGGHAGALSPFALMQEIRAWYDGPVFLSGAIARGDSLLAAQAMGADGGYVGSPFIATQEANAVERYKQMIVDSGAEDIVYSNLFSGVHGNYLKPSIAAQGLDPDTLAQSDPSDMNITGNGKKPKSWTEIWGSGQGIGAIDRIVPAADRINQFKHEYDAARMRMWERVQPEK